MMVENALRFERKSCGRCGGSGRYSYCEMYGDRCFGCGGTGKVLTKRGRAAAQWLKARRMVIASELTPGTWIRSYPGAKAEQVLSIGWTDNEGQNLITGERYVFLEIKTTGAGLMCVGSTPVETVLPTKAERLAELALAIEYQNSLTQAGTPRKR